MFSTTDDLVLQALAILLGRDGDPAGAEMVLHLRKPALEAFAGQRPEVLRRAEPGRGGERRKVQAFRVERHGASLGDGHRVGHRLLGPVREPRPHLLRRLDVELVVVEAHPALVLECLAHADAEEDLVGERVVAPQVVAVVGRDGGRSGFPGEAEEIRQDGGLLRQAMVHQLDEEVAFAEDLLVLEKRASWRPKSCPARAPRRPPLSGIRRAR